MPRPTHKDRDSILADRRKRLLNAAADEIAQNGFVGANVNTISLAAGFATGTIYNYFPSKRVLMVSLIEDIATDHFEYLKESVLEEPDPSARLYLFFQLGFKFVEEHPLKTRVIISAVYGPDEEFRSQVYKAYDPVFVLIIENILIKGMKSGAFQSLDPYDTAAMIMSLYLGGSSQIDASNKIWLEPGAITRFVIEGIHA